MNHKRTAKIGVVLDTDTFAINYFQIIHNLNPLQSFTNNVSSPTLKCTSLFIVYKPLGLYY